MRRTAFLALALVLAAPASGQAPGPWTTQDVIDERIDVHAQYALMRMFGCDPVAATAASAMLSAVKEGALAGIYLPDQKVPALRARALGKGWWQLLPRGADAVCVAGPEGEAPLIVFAKEAKSLSYRLDPALRSAWTACALPWAEPRGYIATLPPKQPAVDPPAGQPTTLTVLVLDSGNAPVLGASVHVLGAGVPAGGGVTDAGGAVTLVMTSGVFSLLVEAPASHGGGSTALAAQVDEGRSNLYTVSVGGSSSRRRPSGAGGPVSGGSGHLGPLVLSRECAELAAGCSASCTRSALADGQKCGADPECLLRGSSRFSLCIASCEAKTFECSMKGKA